MTFLTNTYPMNSMQTVQILYVKNIRLKSGSFKTAEPIHRNAIIRAVGVAAVSAELENKDNH